MAGFSAVICGAGMAGIEGLLRLRRLCGDQVSVTLVDSSEQLVYRPLSVLEPFAPGAVRHYQIQRFVEEAGAAWVRDAVAWVDRSGHVVHTTNGTAVPYDALLLAVGGRHRMPAPHALTFSGPDAAAQYRELLEAVDDGAVTSVAFVVPDGPAWPLPLYEIALLTAQYARDRVRRLEIVLTTPEPFPLSAFGEETGAALSRLLERADISVRTSTRAEIAGPHRVRLGADDAKLLPDRIVTLPVITGPNVRGMPGAGVDRFLDVDEYCRVRDTDGVIFAAGDATDLPVKQGGVGAQQADTAAAGIAHLAGVGDAPPPLRPVIRARLLTGGPPLYLAAHLIAGRGWRAELFDRPPWRLEQKVVAEELGEYLDRLGSSEASSSAG
jgi:sulfide:quinone oxidoreductase